MSYDVHVKAYRTGAKKRQAKQLRLQVLEVFQSSAVLFGASSRWATAILLRQIARESRGYRTYS